MYPLYTPQVELVAWLDDAGNIFDSNMNWIAFISDNNVFSSVSIGWLGIIKDKTILDQSGKPFLWNPDSDILSMSKPFRPFKPFKPFAPFKPFKPFTPFKPFKPFVPSGGWSSHNFDSWKNQI